MNFDNDFQNFLKQIDLKKYDEALNLGKKLLIHKDRNYEVNFLIAIIYFNKKLLSEAEFFFKKSLDIKFNKDENSLYNLGLIAGLQSNRIESESYYLKTISLNKNHFEATFNLANLYLNIGNCKNAIQYYLIAEKIKPNTREVCLNLGHTYLNYDEPKKAQECFLRIQNFHNDPIVLNNIGVTYQALKNYDTAFEYHSAALSKKKDFPECINNIGLIYLKKKDYKNAEKIFIELLKNYDDYKVYLNLALTCFEIFEIDKAKIFFNKAINKNNANSDIYLKYSNFLLETGDLYSARDNILKGIKLNAFDYRLYTLLGTVYTELRDFKKAIHSFSKSKQIKNNSYGSIYNQSFLYFLQSDFSRGWDFYNFRWLVEESLIPYLNIESKLWNGKKFNGTLLVWSEQGIGDHIFFGRMVESIQNIVKEIIFLVDERLVNFFNFFFKEKKISNIKVFSLKKNPKEFIYDFHIPSGSLGFFVAKDKNQIVKFSESKYLPTDNIKDAKFIEDLKSTTSLKVGLSWKSLNKKEQHRSLPLLSLIDYINLKNIVFYNLQFGDYQNEIKALEEKKGVRIYSSRNIDYFNDIDSVSNIIKNLDLVITAQNTIAHLSLAMQKKTFVILPFNHRWQWGTDSKNSIFYPKAILFRQSKLNYWDDVFISVKNELLKNIKENS